ncbi:MAG: hypothetical protein K6G15_03855 [Desulfovibrio sp.]|nr:hypothetical protein [Desulfovibrio sp.]
MIRKLCLLCCLAGLLSFANATQAAEEKLLEEPWVQMPAGARPTYMGIHGGTMPVSLLVSDDGSSLLTFVGRTGNDFLEVLHRTEFQMPSFLKKAAQNSTRDALEQGKTILHAGDKKTSMPVIYITGLGFQRSTVDEAELLPFGFSEKPVSIEGQVRMPDSATPKRKEYRLFFQPRYLIPR